MSYILLYHFLILYLLYQIRFVLIIELEFCAVIVSRVSISFS